MNARASRRCANADTPRRTTAHRGLVVRPPPQPSPASGGGSPCVGGGSRAEGAHASAARSHGTTARRGGILSPACRLATRAPPARSSSLWRASFSWAVPPQVESRHSDREPRSTCRANRTSSSSTSFQAITSACGGAVVARRTARCAPVALSHRAGTARGSSPPLLRKNPRSGSGTAGISPRWRLRVFARASRASRGWSTSRARGTDRTFRTFSARITRGWSSTRTIPSARPLSLSPLPVISWRRVARPFERLRTGFDSAVHSRSS
jgi:hypothetical protein